MCHTLHPFTVIITKCAVALRHGPNAIGASDACHECTGPALVFARLELLQAFMPGFLRQAI
jgi:hypothetical protein